MCNSIELSAGHIEMSHLREQLNEWFDHEVMEVENDEQWARTVLDQLRQRGFVYIEKCGGNEVLSCLGYQEKVHVARGPNRPLAIARAIRKFADNACECHLLAG